MERVYTYLARVDGEPDGEFEISVGSILEPRDHIEVRNGVFEVRYVLHAVAPAMHSIVVFRRLR